MHSHRRKMITKMTDTPETDGEWNRIACYDHPQFEHGIAEFARKLERERDEAREYADKLVAHKDMVCLPKDLEVLRGANLGLAVELHEARDQRDRLAEAVNAATVLIAAKGRHNTMLAYEGLRKALDTPNQPNL